MFWFNMPEMCINTLNLILQNIQAYCKMRENWLLGREWANYAFTDKMSIEVGAVFGLNHVWRDKTEQ